MNKIKALPPDLISKIAAGEVVERPASVVKELVENSLDAGAQYIAVEVDLGGTAKISVSDDGVGMTVEDAQLAVERHTTSKIEKFDDLYALETMGFRGEALASIASVSQFSLKTKIASELTGVELVNSPEGWQVRETGGNRGTQVTVKNLFYNVPARRKFLRSAATEYQHIVQLMEGFAVAWPKVGFRLVSNGKIALNWPATDWPTRCHQVLGDVFKEFKFLQFDGDFKLNGWLGRPAIATSRRVQFLFINQRLVNDYLISRAIKEAYGNLIPKDCYPVFVLKIDLPPGRVDVNVHPRKTEVKIVNPGGFYQELLRLVQGAIIGGPLPTAGVSNTDRLNFGFNLPPERQLVSQAIAQTLALGTATSGQSAIASPGFTILGQINRAYLLVLDQAGLTIYDQHAISERIVYESLAVGSEKSRQAMLTAFNLDLSASDMALYQEFFQRLADCGWQIETFGERTLMVRAVPAVVRQIQAAQILTRVLGDLANSKANGQDDLRKSLACHAAVRFGDYLTPAEQQKLISEGLEKNVQSCPHGRPVSYKISWEELEKVFRRR